MLASAGKGAMPAIGLTEHIFSSGCETAPLLLCRQNGSTLTHAWKQPSAEFSLLVFEIISHIKAVSIPTETEFSKVPNRQQGWQE